MDVAIDYYNLGSRSARGAWFIRNIPLMARKILLTKNFQVFSYDQKTDSFTYRERSAFDNYIKMLSITKFKLLLIVLPRKNQRRRELVFQMTVMWFKK